MAVALALLAGSAALDPAAGTHVVSRRDVAVLKERIRADATSRSTTVEGLRRRLLRGRDEASTELLVDAIRRRLLRELEAKADSLRGTRVTSLDAATESLEREERILCYDAIVWPEGFASGAHLAFVVDDADVIDLRSRLMEMVREQVIPIRTTVRQFVQQRDITPSESRALRDRIEARALARGHRAVDEVRGGRFFSRADVEQFVLNEISAELADLHPAVRDESTRRQLLEEPLPGS